MDNDPDSGEFANIFKWNFIIFILILFIKINGFFYAYLIKIKIRWTKFSFLFISFQLLLNVDRHVFKFSFRFFPQFFFLKIAPS